MTAKDVPTGAIFFSPDYPPYLFIKEESRIGKIEVSIIAERRNNQWFGSIASNSISISNDADVRIVIP